MVDDVLVMMKNQARGLKLGKLQTLISADKPTEYADFAKSIIASDKDDHYLLNKVAWFVVCPDSETQEEKDVSSYREGGKIVKDAKGNASYMYMLMKHGP